MPNTKPKTKANNEPYRKVKITMWDDPKFRALSALPPSGQSLFIYLLTSPFTGIIPGLFKAGRAAISEELGWEVEAFDLALGEALALGMVKADMQARVFWLPNAAKHNPPASLNVVKSWVRAFELLPDCPLKWEARESLKAVCYGVSNTMGDAFDKALPLPKDMPSPLPSGIQIAVNSKQILKDQNLLRGAEKISPPPPEENRESCGLNLHDGTRPAHAGPERRPLSAGVPEMPRPDDPEFIRLPLNDGSEFTVGESLVSEFESLYPAVDVRQALRNQRGWLLSDRRRLKTARGIKKFITGWLAKDQDRGGNRGRDSPSRIQDLPPPDNVIPPGFRG